MWENRYTGDADTCGQGQIPAPNLCLCEVVVCIVRDSERPREAETALGVRYR